MSNYKNIIEKKDIGLFLGELGIFNYVLIKESFIDKVKLLLDLQCHEFYHKIVSILKVRFFLKCHMFT